MNPLCSERRSQPRRRALRLMGGCALLVTAAVAGIEQPARAEEPPARPKIVLDHLDFPAELGAKKYEKHLRRELTREARRVDWGASSDSTIQYRYAVKRLTVINREGKVLVVRCEATGRLPNGRVASGSLTFSGAPGERDALVEKVLGIVARGVIARLADIERERRGAN